MRDILLLPIFVALSSLVFPSGKFILRQGFGSADVRKYLCQMNSSTMIKSSQRDVVLFYTSDENRGLIMSLKSLRSTGSLCRIVLFVPSSFSASQYFKDLLRALRVEVIPNCDSTGNRTFVPHMIRFEYEIKWIKENINSISRILHTDANDVFFQGDPFSRHVSRDSLTFVIEPHCIRSCGWNFAWIKNCYGESILQQMRHFFIACSGTIAGSASEYMKLVELMIKQPQWSSCWSPSQDQPILNYLLWMGKIKDAGIKYQLTGCDDGFFTMQWCVMEHQVRTNEFGQVISLSNEVPTYLHQYNREKNFTERLYKMCGIE